MLQVTQIIAEKDHFIEGLKKRGIQDAATLLEEVMNLDQKRKATQQELDSNLSEANSISKQIGSLMKAGKRDEAEVIKAKTADLRSKNKELAEVLDQVQEALKQALYNIPNVPHESVPAGQTDEDNEVIETVGELPALGEGAKAHWDLIKEHDIIDFELGIKITGAGFPVYKGKGASGPSSTSSWTKRPRQAMAKFSPPSWSMRPRAMAQASYPTRKARCTILGKKTSTSSLPLRCPLPTYIAM